MNNIYVRLFTKINKTKTCWMWEGAKFMRSGYAQTRIKGKLKYAHRIMWECVNGRIGKHLNVLHTCDTPACVNPKHLWLGTHEDNMLDKKQKGRAPGQLGMKHPMAKLTNLDVRNIRFFSCKKIMSRRKLREIYRISKSQIARIINLQSWKHI